VRQRISNARRSLDVEFLAGVRGSLALANGPNPLGPPPPLAAAALKILF